MVTLHFYLTNTHRFVFFLKGRLLRVFNTVERKKL